jgi:hypothetical protein
MRGVVVVVEAGDWGWRCRWLVPALTEIGQCGETVQCEAPPGAMLRRSTDRFSLFNVADLPRR